MGNMFNLVIFGKMAEEDMGSLGGTQAFRTPFFRGLGLSEFFVLLVFLAMPGGERKKEAFRCWKC